MLNPSRNGFWPIIALAIALRLAAALAMRDTVKVLPAIYDQVSYDTLGQSRLRVDL